MRVFRAASFVTLLAACSPATIAPPPDSGTDSAAAAPDASTDTDAGASVSKTCSDRAYAYCSHLQSCSSSAVELRYQNLAGCEASEGALCMNAALAPSTGSTIAALEACTAAIPNWVCNDFIQNQNRPPECENPGSLPNGASCAVAQQCQSDYCALPNGNPCGSCAAVPPAGTSCATVGCPNGLVCVTSTQVCSPLALLGAMCNGGLPCSDGLTCAGATSTTSGVCQMGVQTAGAPCTFLGAGCDLYSGLACNVQSATCVTAHLGQAGEACGVVANQAASCINGACVRGYCAGYVPIGGACDGTAYEECETGSRCIMTDDAGTGTCQVNGSSACP